MVKKSAVFSKTHRPLKILIVKHSLGNRYGGPAEDLEKFLVSEYPEAIITVQSHPLTAWSTLESTTKIFTNGNLTFQKVTARKIRGQARHLLDLFFGPKRTEYDVVFGFNSFAVLLGILSCKNQDAKFVAWGVDFVPHNHRVGPLNFLLNLLQRWLSRRINVRVENTKVALEERDKASPLSPSAHSYVVPIGVWRKDFEIASNLQSKTLNKLLYLGSINERTGIPLLVEALHELNQMNIDFTCDVVGDGPLLDWLKDQILIMELEEKVFVHGYLPDYPETKELLSNSSIGLAPFSAEAGSFTFFTDPQKIRRYLSSGLVAVCSNVPPIARELSSNSGLVSISSNETAEAWAKTIAGLLSNPEELLSLQNAALDFSETFENSYLFEKLTKEIFGT